MAKMKCIFTGDEVDYEHQTSTLFYSLTVANNPVSIFICDGCKDNLKITVEPQIVKGLIANKRFPERVFVHSESCNAINNVVDSISIVPDDYLKQLDCPKTPLEKLNNLLLTLYKRQKIEGERLLIPIEVEHIGIKCYFRSTEECYFYIRCLAEDGFLVESETGNAPKDTAIKFTLKGLNKITEFEKQGHDSKTCFIAMAFDEKTKPYREAIKKALTATNYTPYIIDEEHLSSDKTIPDGILAGIRKSKFCVADFTLHRNGVYFESGYAVGLGKPVIYICEKKEFDKAHFDIKQLQHIIYTDASDLERKLIDKINAWIN